MVAKYIYVNSMWGDGQKTGKDCFSEFCFVYVQFVRCFFHKLNGVEQ